MKISPELFLSILAMDSYNRGYGSGITNATSSNGETDETGLGRVGSTIGTATVIADNNSPEAQESSFYAIAYDYGGQTIISYRGTDVQPGLFPPRLGDAATGWPIGAGIIEGTQVDLARVFYEQVTQTSLFDGGAGSGLRFHAER